MYYFANEFLSYVSRYWQQMKIYLTLLKLHKLRSKSSIRENCKCMFYNILVIGSDNKKQHKIHCLNIIYKLYCLNIIYTQ